MPSDKHNSRTAWARDLISSLINVASSRDVPFHQPQLLQCLYQGATFDLPYISSQPRSYWGDDLRYTRNGFSTRHKDCWGASCAMPCLLCYETSSPLLKLRCTEIEALWLQDRDMGARFHEYILRIFRNGWMDCRDTFHAVLCLHCYVMSTTGLSRKHTGLSVIQKLILEAHISYTLSCKVVYTQIKQLNYYAFKK